MAESKITRAAVGRFAHLGDLYDARRDRFISKTDPEDSLKKAHLCDIKSCSSEVVGNNSNSVLITANFNDEPLTMLKSDSNLNQSSSADMYSAMEVEYPGVNAFKDSLNEDEIVEEKKTGPNAGLITTDSLNEQFEKLGIETELRQSIMSGLIDLGGAAAYLKSQKSSAKSTRMTVTYTLNTIQQEVDGVRSKVNMDCLDAAEATHIVVGIDWGATCNITCYYQGSNNEDEEQVKANLLAEVKKLKEVISVKSNSDDCYLQVGEESVSKFSYYINCDIITLEKCMPTTLQGVLAIATSLRKAVLNENGGKGIPIRYKLMSLNTVRAMCKKPRKMDEISHPILESSFMKLLETFQAVKLCRQQLNDLIDDFHENRNAISSAELSSASCLLERFDNEEADFTFELGKALVNDRSGSCHSQNAINKVIQHYREKDYGPEKICSAIEKYTCTRKKLLLIHEFKANGVLYIGKDGRKEDALHCSKEKTVYLFNMNHAEYSERPEEWEKQKELFSRLILAHGYDDKVDLIAVDCELDREMTPKQSTCIEFYVHGKCLYKDLLHEEYQDIEECTIKMCISDSMEKKPSKRVLLEIMCPQSFSGICKDTRCPWVCKHCKELVEYGIDDGFLYCKCGKADVFDSKFRCNDIRHGLSFTKFDADAIAVALSPLREVEPINIVLLGETGVGKSTWINAIANYVAFQTLQDAVDANGIKVYIPSQFLFTSESGAVQKISIGSNFENEVEVAGHSTTQIPRAYKLHIGKHLITLLDTPGIGDIRGFDQDNENLENILAHLSQFSEIHGICIFLKPNTARITTAFSLCIRVLLAHLHRSATENIVFCFTNARSTMYKPGDTHSILQMLLKDLVGPRLSISADREFYFDNEGFRVLACIVNGVSVNKEDFEAYSSSWDRTVSDTYRLFERVKMLKPHSTNCTIALNYARELVFALSKSLTKAGKAVQENIDASDAKYEELQVSQQTTQELNDKLYVDSREPTISFSRTVCTDTSCAANATVQIYVLLMYSELCCINFFHCL